jgi:DNA-binding IclR family transcriptional regulator
MTGETSWTFLTNHSHVLICLTQDSEMRLRDVALKVGITERAVQRIVAELEEGGVVTRHREGRRNRYEIHPEIKLRHAIEAHRSVAEIIALGEK